MTTTHLMEAWSGNGSPATWSDISNIRGSHDVDDSTSMVIEIEPGTALGRGDDGRGAILIVMEGEVTFRIGDERVHASPGTVTVVPAKASPLMHNNGAKLARIVGFVPQSNGVRTTATTQIQPLTSAALSLRDESGQSAAG